MVDNPGDRVCTGGGLGVCGRWATGQEWCASQAMMVENSPATVRNRVLDVHNPAQGVRNTAPAVHNPPVAVHGSSIDGDNPARVVNESLISD